LCFLFRNRFRKRSALVIGFPHVGRWDLISQALAVGLYLGLLARRDPKLRGLRLLPPHEVQPGVSALETSANSKVKSALSITYLHEIAPGTERCFSLSEATAHRL